MLKRRLIEARRKSGHVYAGVFACRNKIRRIPEKAVRPGCGEAWKNGRSRYGSLAPQGSAV